MPTSQRISHRHAEQQRSPSPSDQLLQEMQLQSISSSNQGKQRRSPRINDQLQQRKRQRRHNQQARLLQSSQERPSSASSSATSIGQYYGLGDYNALNNLFAAYTQRLSSLPRPHGSQGAHEPFWELRFDHEIYLQNDFFLGESRSQRVRAPVPGPERDPFASLSPEPESPQSAHQPPTRTRAEFQSAMSIVQDVIGEGRRLTMDLARSYERVRAWRERWGWSPLSSDAYDSPPQYSPPRQLPTQSLQTSPRPESIGSSSSWQTLSPGPEKIPNPPIPGDPAPSAEALFEIVNAFAKENGFGIVRRNGYSYKGRRIRYSFQCDRFGQPQPTQGAGIRSRKSRKCGCQWMVIAEAKEEGKWLLRHHPNQEHSQHNHERSIASSAHPSHRRLTTPVKATIESTSRRVGIRARDVRAVVEQEHPDTTFTQRDIYNARARINREKLNGYTSTAALIKLFDEIKIPYLVKWADDDPNQLLGLVWTFPYCLQMWKRFPEVISFDNTYNTNRFKLPLFQATGQTCLGTVYNAAFGLIDNERREGFQFLAESMRQLVDEHSIRQPDVIITDFDDAMKAALNDQFPDVQQQLCIHHILSNVMLKSKQRWVNGRQSSSSSDLSDDEDTPSQTQTRLSAVDKQLINASTEEKIPHTYQGILLMWKRVLFAETEDAHEQAWKDLCREFDDQRFILLYLYKTYLPVRAQWARCFIRYYRNFSIRVTSSTEASNNNVKSYLLNGMSHLYRLVEAIQDMMHDQERDFKDACAQDEVLTGREYLGSIGHCLGELKTAMSSKGLKLVSAQYRITRRFMPSEKNTKPKGPGVCNNDCTVSTELGIPCYHTVYEKISSGMPFSKREIHPRWLLRESKSRDPYQRITDPKIATMLRGRPKNTGQSIPAQLAIITSSQSASHPASQSTIHVASQQGIQRLGRPPGSLNKPTLARRAQEAEQTAPRPRRPTARLQAGNSSRVLRSGKTTGVRSSGQRTQLNIRRTRSQWELV